MAEGKDDKGAGGGLFGFANDLSDLLKAAPQAIASLRSDVSKAVGATKTPMVSAFLLQQVDVGVELVQIWHIKTTPEVVLGIATHQAELRACIITSVRSLEDCQKYILQSFLTPNPKAEP
jgi:hypothetical protein